MKNRPSVYVVQVPHRHDPQKGRLVPVVDLSDAKRFGELKFLTGPNAKPFDSSVIQEIERNLRHFKPTDFLLLIGAPILMGIATAYAADVAGTVKFLSWNGRESAYTPVEIEVFELEPETEDRPK